jgi:hypothetical protein
MRCVLHLEQLALSFRPSLIIRHFLHKRGNGTTESLDQLFNRRVCILDRVVQQRGTERIPIMDTGFYGKDRY